MLRRNLRRSRRFFASLPARQRRLRFEPLEDRRLLAILVNTLLDQNDGAANGTSLREAIQTAPPNETIDFAPDLSGGVIKLTLGQLVINRTLTINGPGAELLAIDASGNDPTPGDKNGNGSRVFQIGGAPNSVVTIRGLTMAGGDVLGSGGGIMNIAGTLIVADAKIKDNAASSFGGGIFTNGGSVIVQSSSISSNSARGGSGGGIYATNAFVSVSDSIISGNVATSITSVGSGGGIWTRNGILTVEHSQISVNTAKISGGGIFSSGGDVTVADSVVESNTAQNGAGIRVDAVETLPTLTVLSSAIRNNTATGNNTTDRGGGIAVEKAILSVTNSTISGNSARVGGGISSTVQNLDISSSTISGNSALNGPGVYINASSTSTVQISHSTIASNQLRNDGQQQGVGIRLIGGGNTPALHVLDHTIVAGNLGTSTSAQDIGGPFALRYSFVGRAQPNDPAIINLGGSLIGTVIAPINPLLGPLSDNGGSTLPDGSTLFTHPLLVGSPALDVGNPAAVAGVGLTPFFDERGVGFSRVVDGKLAGIPRIDMGAYERQTVAPLTLVVDTLVDELDGNYSKGDFSLREAIFLSNQNPGIDTILFDPALTAAGPATIVLSIVDVDSHPQDGRSALLITDALVIHGPGADRLTIDARGNDHTPDQINRDGSRVFKIGDSNEASPHPVDAVITGLALTGGDVSARGGAILSFGDLTIIDCAIRDNAAIDGGGLFSSGGDVVVQRSTISGNIILGRGGGIYSRNGDVLIEHSAVSDNSANNSRGGGLYHHDGNVAIVDSTISGNSAAGGGGGIVLARIGSLSVTGSTISDNSTQQNGGGIIVSTSGNLSVADSTIRHNSAVGDGGGIFGPIGGTTISGSTVSDNSAHNGAGILSPNGSLTVLASTISGNEATGSGGGVMTAGGSLSVINSTISGNSATDNGGGFNLTVNPAAAVIRHSTITANAAGGFGGGAFLIDGGLTFNHAIVAANFGAYGSDVTGLLGTTLSAAFSLIGSNVNSGLAEAPVGAPDADGNLIGGPIHGGINPLLGLLAFNGGPTMTHALLADSPAIDTGDPSAMAWVGSVPEFDQRGMPFGRVADGDGNGGLRIDMGAFEWQPNPLPGDYNYDQIVDLADYIVWRGTCDSTTDLSADGDCDGIVGQDDLTVWAANFGNVWTPPAASIVNAVQQPPALPEVGLALHSDSDSDVSFAPAESSAPERVVGSRLLRSSATSNDSASRDDALLAWLSANDDRHDVHDFEIERDAVGPSENNFVPAVDDSLEAELVNWDDGL